MNNKSFTSIIAIGFAAVVATITTSNPAAAQTPHTANVPFAFAADGVQYPAGAYEISHLGTYPVVVLKNLGTRAGHLVSMPIPVGQSGSSSPKLVFVATEDGYQLSEVWLDGSVGMRSRQAMKSGETASVKVAIR